MCILVMQHFSLVFSPKCRFEYSQSQCPTRYYCFCGKQPDPKCDPWLVPHSCGNVCGRKLSPDCGHTCLLLCHPGKFCCFLPASAQHNPTLKGQIFKWNLHIFTLIFQFSDCSVLVNIMHELEIHILNY